MLPPTLSTSYVAPLTDPASRLRDDALSIFLFHGVVREHRHRIRNFTRKHVDRDRFIQILSDLRESGRPLSMDDAVVHHREDRPFPARSFAVTFDDGFENNFSVAAPILDEMNIPAMFYVTTGFVSDNAMSWIDRIELAMEQAMPVSIHLPWEQQDRMLNDAEGAMEALQEIRRVVKQDPRIVPQRLADDLCRQCGVDAMSSDDPLDRKLTWQQVRELAANPLFAVGGHTHTHPILSHLAPQAMRMEISRCLGLLRDQAGIRARHFSYPEGLAHCYSAPVIEELRRRGIECCPTAIDGHVKPGDDLFELHRVMVT